MAPWDGGRNFRSVIDKPVLQIYILNTSREIAIKWMPHSQIDDKWTLFQVKAWHRGAMLTENMLLFGVTWSTWVDMLMSPVKFPSDKETLPHISWLRTLGISGSKNTLFDRGPEFVHVMTLINPGGKYLTGYCLYTMNTFDPQNSWIITFMQFSDDPYNPG